MKGKDRFKKNKIIIILLTGIFKVLPITFRKFIYDSTSMFGGSIFIGIRYALLKTMFKKMGQNVYIGKYVTIKHHSKISIGNNVSIHDFSYVDGQGELIIKDNVSIAHNCSILTANHGWNDKTIPIKYNKQTQKKVIIKEDVWIGCAVRILSGVTINNRTVIAAGAVVNKSVSENCLVGGVPAKLIKKI